MHRSELSATGLCAKCGPKIQNEQIAQLVEHRGPHFEHWQRQCARAFQWVTLDDERASA